MAEMEFFRIDNEGAGWLPLSQMNKEEFDALEKSVAFELEFSKYFR